MQHLPPQVDTALTRLNAAGYEAYIVGAVAELLQNAELLPLRRQLGLDESSAVLCISTEGDTDRENYRKILSEA